jgi:hypothetical protein
VRDFHALFDVYSTTMHFCPYHLGRSEGPNNEGLRRHDGSQTTWMVARCAAGGLRVLYASIAFNAAAILCAGIRARAEHLDGFRGHMLR